MPLPRPTRPVSLDQEEIAAPVSQTVHRGEKTKYKPSDVFFYDPKPDVTAFEAAQLVAILFNGIMVHHEFFEKIPEHLKRHFEHKKTV